MGVGHGKVDATIGEPVTLSAPKRQKKAGEGRRQSMKGAARGAAAKPVSAMSIELAP